MSGIRTGRTRVLAAAGVAVLLVGIGWATQALLIAAANSAGDSPQPATLAALTQAQHNEAAGERVASLANAAEPLEAESLQKLRGHEVTIRKPAGPPRVELGVVDAHGNQVTAACSTCHATRPPNVNNRTTASLNEFHQNVTVSHGSVSCLSCHNPGDYDTLHLADGRTVEFTNVMTLCAQCHGPQTRDYQHGAHGGMTGHWDLSRGPRMRNNCVDCHDPHSPGFPAMKPTFKPRDRFLEHKEHGGDKHGQ